MHPDDELDETPGWRAVGVVLGNDPIDVLGVDPWGVTWRDTGGVVAVRHPSWPTQVHRVPVYRVIDGLRTVTFAAGELSNQVWGFFVPTGVAVRRAEPDEWRAYQAIRVRALLDSPEAFTSTVERERGFDESEWRRRLTASHTLIAWRDGVAVGTIAAFRDDRAGGWAVVALWVDPGVRGSGVAGSLLDAIADEARTEGVHRLRLWVMVDNAPARSLYDRRGWVATGDTERLPDGRDEIALELTLAR